jgi:flagellar biosynthesis GTPase FlhF
MKTTNGRSPPTDPTHSRAHHACRLCTNAPIGRIIEIILKNHLNKKVMKTTVIESGKNTAVTGKANNSNGATAKAGSTNLNPQPFNNGNGKAESEPKKVGTPTPVQATEQAKPQTEQPKEVKAEAPKTETEQPKAEPTKTEIKEQLAQQKPALNLEGTLKLVEELHRRKIQRDKLLDTIDTLETFEVSQKDDAEETDSNHFQGCQLTIEDDQRREFTTKNPFIIKKVAGYINALCLDRLAEIEGEIYLPA